MCVTPLAPAVGIVNPEALHYLDSKPHYISRNFIKLWGQPPSSTSWSSCSPDICTRSILLPSAPGCPCGRGITEGWRGTGARRLFHSVKGLIQAFSLAPGKLWSILAGIAIQNEVRSAREGCGRSWALARHLGCTWAWRGLDLLQVSASASGSAPPLWRV